MDKTSWQKHLLHLLPFTFSQVPEIQTDANAEQMEQMF